MYTYDSRIRYKSHLAYQRLSSPVFKYVFWASLVISVLLWLALTFYSSEAYIAGFTLMSTSVTLGSLLILTFAKTFYPYIDPPKTVKQLLTDNKSNDINIANAASVSLIAALGRHGKKQDKESLINSIIHLSRSVAIKHLVSRLQVDRKKMIKAIDDLVVPVITWDEFTRRTIEVADKLNQDYIRPEHAIGALLGHPSLQAAIRSINLTENDIEFMLWWGAEHQSVEQYKKRWWDAQRLLSFTGIGLSWASGFTPFVDRFARLPPGNVWDDVLYGHEKKIDELINTLARQRQSNVLLVGDPGVGRLGILRELSRRVIRNNAHAELNGQRLLYINAGELIAEGSTGASQFGMVTRALKEMERAGNIIAIIDGLSSILGRSGEQAVNLTDVLTPFLASTTVRVVVMTSTEDYHLRLKTNQDLIHFFEIVQIPSLDVSATMRRIALATPNIERQSHIYIPYRTIRTLVEDTDSIMPQIPFPERAFDFLEEAIVLAQNEGAKNITEQHIHTLISRKIGIDLGNLKDQEKQKLLNLDDIMHQRVVNQHSAIQAVTKALIRARAEVRSQKRPIGTFLFLGPTGVGKTETAKTLAEAYFGSEDHMIRIDMSEFQGSDGVNRLIGSASNPVGRLTSLVADHPFTVVLLDEFEKASSQVHQLFLQVFDEGRLTDAAGKTYSFLHTIIIATSNAGAEMIRTSIVDGNIPEGFDQQLKDHILSNNLLRPELLNRFDDVIVYSTLTAQHIRQVAKLMLRGLNQRLDAQHGVSVDVTDELVEYLVSIGYNPEFGARPMSRAIQDTVEYTVAQKILKGEIQPGQKISLPVASLQSL